MALVVALGLRLWGVNWQLPWQFHPDEGHYTWKALGMIGDGNLNPKYFRNPTFFTYVLYGQYRLLGFQAPAADPDAATSDGLLRPPSGVAFVGRLNSALFGTGTVAVLAWIGWRLLGPWTGVLAAVFLGVAFIHVRDSHYATNDVPATFLLMLSFAATLEILRRPTARAYLFAALFGGLAASTKYNVGLFFVPLVVASGLAAFRLTRRLALLAVAGVVSLLAYLVGTPYTLLEFDKFRADFRTQMRLGQEEWEGQAAVPSGLLYLQTFGQGIGWVMLGLAVVGLILLARRQTRATAVVAAFPVSYLAFMLRTELFFVRFALPIVPFLCLFAACGVVLMTGPARRGRWGKTSYAAPALGAMLAVVAVAQPLGNSVLHNVLISREDTRSVAARWALTNIPRDAKVGVQDYSIRDRRPRAYGGPSWELDSDEFKINKTKGADPTAALRRFHYLILSSFYYQRFGGNAPETDPRRMFYDALESQGRLLAEFAPTPTGVTLPFDLEDLYTPFWDLGRYERPGPTIRIYVVNQP